jgi:hypothetical protein
MIFFPGVTMEVFSYAAQGRMALGSSPAGSFAREGGLYAIGIDHELDMQAAYGMD